MTADPTATDAVTAAEEAVDLEGLEPFLVLESDGVVLSFYDTENEECCVVNVEYAKGDERWSMLDDPDARGAFVHEVIQRLVEVGEGLSSDLLVDVLNEQGASEEA